MSELQRCIETVSPHGIFYDTVQAPFRAKDMQLI